MKFGVVGILNDSSCHRERELGPPLLVVLSAKCLRWGAQFPHDRLVLSA